MEKERIRFLTVWVSHVLRATRLPPTLFASIIEGKVSGYPSLPGVKIGDNHIITVELPESEQTLTAISGMLTVFHRYMFKTYDEIIAREKLLRPAKEFLEKNKERLDALQLGSFIPPVIGELAGAPKPEERQAAISSRATHVQSGVQGFDSLLGGGMPRNTSVLLQAPTGNEPELFANQFIRQSLEERAPVLVVVAGQSPADLRASLKSLGARPEEAEATGQLRIIDWYSHRFERVNGIEEAGSVTRVSKDLTNVSIALNKAMRSMPDTGPRRAVVKLLSKALTEFDFETVYGFAESTKAKFKNNSITALFLIDKEAHPQSVLSAFHKVFDGVVDIERRRVEVRVVSEMSVLAMSGVQVRSEYLPVKVDGTGRLMVEPTPIMPSAGPQLPTERATDQRPSQTAIQRPGPAPQAPQSAGTSAPTSRHSVGYSPQPAGQRTPAQAASALAKSGRKMDALKAYDEILSKDPNNFEALNGKALVLQLQGSHREALKLYDLAVRSNPSDAETWSNRGISLRAMGRTEEAIQSYDHALELNPRDAGVWSNRGIALRTLGRTDEAIESYDKALDINPKDAGVWSNRGVALTSVGKYEEALESFDRALEADPYYEKARKNRQVLVEKMER
jgi:Flp pilus assembly protein TadD/KaiC/GvpD/RAD55 family RecA-like ATPase